MLYSSTDRWAENTPLLIEKSSEMNNMEVVDQQIPN